MPDTEKTTPPEDPTHYEQYAEHYNEDDFWDKVKTLPRSAVGQVLEKALLLRELLLDSATPLWIKGTIAGVLGYLILPIDLVPDLLPGIGFVDDVAAMGLVLANLDQWVTDETRERALARLPAGFRTPDES